MTRDIKTNKSQEKIQNFMSLKKSGSMKACEIGSKSGRFRRKKGRCINQKGTMKTDNAFGQIDRRWERVEEESEGSNFWWQEIENLKLKQLMQESAISIIYYLFFGIVWGNLEHTQTLLEHSLVHFQIFNLYMYGILVLNR